MNALSSLPIVALVACASVAQDPSWPDIVGSPDDPDFCVNTEADGRKYTANNASPNDVQKSTGAKQGHYPYPVNCLSRR